MKSNPLVTLSEYNGFTEVRTSARCDIPRGGGRRGNVTTFSQSSRNRLLRLVSCLPIGSFGCFITLTYGVRYPNHDQTKRHLDLLLKRMARIKPNGWVLWRLEWQERGAPHFHLVTSHHFTWDDIYGFWLEILGADYCESFDPDAFEAFIAGLSAASRWREGTLREYYSLTGLVGPLVQSRKIQGRKQTIYYVSKYCAKLETTSPTSRDEGRAGSPARPSARDCLSMSHILPRSGRRWGIRGNVAEYRRPRRVLAFYNSRPEYMRLKMSLCCNGAKYLIPDDKGCFFFHRLGEAGMFDSLVSVFRAYEFRAAACSRGTVVDMLKSYEEVT